MLVSLEALLQANATVIAGALILLTLTFFGTGLSEIQNRFYIYYYVALIIIPLAVSSVLIVLLPVLHLWAVFGASISGYIILGLFIGYLAFLNSPLVAKESISMQCAIEPKKFNVTEPFECANFSPGSLAEQCAFDPKKFNVKLEECLKFIPED